MGADINVVRKEPIKKEPLDIDNFINTPEITPKFPSIPEYIKEDVNSTASSNIDKFKKSFVNFNVTGGKFGELKIDGINSDLKLEDIPKVIPNNRDFNPNNSDYYTIGKLKLSFKTSFKNVYIPYSMIKINDNELEVIFYSKDTNGEVYEKKVISVKEKSGIERYNIEFKNYNSDLLGKRDLELKINIDWK